MPPDFVHRLLEVVRDGLPNVQQDWMAANLFAAGVAGGKV